jgi:hypothetical protein
MQGYIRRERERANALATGHLMLFFGLTLLKIFVRYGYQPSLSLVWATATILIGAIVFKTSLEAETEGYKYGLAFSFDILLPIIKLREKHYDIDFAGWQRYYFYGHRLMGFVLGTLIGAVISGLIQ